MTTVIELKDASFGYGERAIVTGASLAITRGEVVAVLGANGSASRP